MDLSINTSKRRRPRINILKTIHQVSLSSITALCSFIMKYHQLNGWKCMGLRIFNCAIRQILQLFTVIAHKTGWRVWCILVPSATPRSSKQNFGAEFQPPLHFYALLFLSCSNYIRHQRIYSSPFAEINSPANVLQKQGPMKTGTLHSLDEGFEVLCDYQLWDLLLLLQGLT